MTETMSRVRADFDRIAAVSQDGWGHNAHYHSFLLKQIPAQCETALDVGCGTGAFSRLLAERANRVVALDLSPRSIEIAQQRSKAYPNIEFQVADATRWAFPAETFDCVVSIATLHHLPIEEMLQKMKSTLKAQGTLAILDLYDSAQWQDVVTGLVAVPVSVWLRLVKTGRLRQPRQLREAWAAHGKTDIYPPMTEVRQICSRSLPGAEVKRHLLWRYSILWRKVG
jgi:ubiquinone/menaquinone biosynthesis C-methylase UbiE